MTRETTRAACTECGTYPCDDHDTVDLTADDETGQD